MMTLQKTCCFSKCLKTGTVSHKYKFFSSSNAYYFGKKTDQPDLLLLLQIRDYCIRENEKSMYLIMSLVLPYLHDYKILLMTLLIVKLYIYMCMYIYKIFVCRLILESFCLLIIFSKVISCPRYNSYPRICYDNSTENVDLRSSP